MPEIHEANDFKKPEMQRLEEIVSQRTNELQEELRINREMNERLSESNKRLNAFLQISRKITTTIDQRELMQEIVDNATATVNIESGALYMKLDSETISLAATVPALPKDLPGQFRFALIKDHPHIHKVLTSNRYVLVEDSETAVLTPAEQEIIRIRNLRTILYLPISLWEDLIGVLILGSTHEKHHFTDEEIALLQGFAHQAAQVNENVRNYEHTKEYTRKLEREITEHKRTELALQQAGHILENMQIGLYVYELENPDEDRSLRLVATNPASGKLSGVQPTELVGKYIDEIFPSLRDLGIPKRFADVVRTGKAGEFEDIYYADDRLLKAAYAVKAFPLPNQRVGITFDNITRRKQAEDEQRKSEERYRKVISTVPDLIVLTDIGGNIKFINDIPFPSLINRPKETFLGQNMLSFIAEDDLPIAIENTRLMFDRKLGPKEYKLKTEDENVIYSEINGDVIYDTDNMPTGMVYVIRDITERKRAEAALRIGEERFKSIIAISNTGAWEYHHDGNFLWCSREYFTMLGRHPEDYPMDGSANLTETWIDLLHPDDRERALRHFEDYLAGGSVGMYESNFRLKHINGNWVWIWSRGQTLRDRDGKLTNRTLGTHIDITGSKQAEEELIKAKEKVEINEQKLKDALEIGKLGGWELNIKTGIFTFTDSFYKIFHTTAEKIGGYQMTISDYAQRFVHPEDAFQVAEENKKAIESTDPGFSRSLEHRIIYDDGGVGYISVRFFIVKDELGNTIKTYGVNQDITEKKLAEFELVNAKEKAEESDRLKSAFLANMSHEIRTPMNGILGFAELLKEPDLTGDEKQQYIEIIEKSGRRMLNIINDIVDISKIEAGLMELHLSESNINDQIDFIYDFFKPEATAKGLRLSVKKMPDRQEAILITDREKLYAILTNLVKNSIKYTDIGEIEIGCLRKGDFLEFYVKDTGIGIPKFRQKAIFERFIQADIEDKMAFQGAGLGLSISKAYVEMLGGEIRVESEEGKGSTFYFTLPYTCI